MQQDYSILVDKKDNDYWTTTLKRIRTCNCHHTHDTFKNYAYLTTKCTRKGNKKKIKISKRIIVIILRHTQITNNARLDIWYYLE